MFGIPFAITLVASRNGGKLTNVCKVKHIRQIHHLSPHRFTTIMGNTAHFIPCGPKKITRRVGLMLLLQNMACTIVQQRIPFLLVLLQDSKR
ncbi:hypothetical protein D3C73_548590 [compost metagenome]